MQSNDAERQNGAGQSTGHYALEEVASDVALLIKDMMAASR